MNIVYPTVPSENGDWFVKSDYWKRWARCLVRMDETHDEAIDVSIEPLNFVDPEHANRYSSYEVDRLLEVRIRVHRTHNPEYCFKKELPGDKAKYVQALVGDELAHFFLHEDIFAEIDHDKLARYDHVSNWPWGGGIPFVMVCKDRDKYPQLVKHWVQVMEKEVHYLKVQDEDMIRRYNEYLKKEPAQ